VKIADGLMIVIAAFLISSIVGWVMSLAWKLGWMLKDDAMRRSRLVKSKNGRVLEDKEI
jgi:hypothetical protein